MGATAIGTCESNGSHSCTLTGGPAFWIRANPWLFYVVIAGAVSLCSAAHTMELFQKKANFDARYYYAILAAFTFCLAYITLFACAEYALADGKALTSVGVATTFQSAVYAGYLHGAKDLPKEFKDFRLPFFIPPVLFSIFFTYILAWHDLGTNGTMSIWMMIVGIFFWFETDFAMDHKMKVRENFLSVMFVYFEFLVFCYCVNSQVSDSLAF